jgi:hypothetical protein
VQDDEPTTRFLRRKATSNPPDAWSMSIWRNSLIGVNHDILIDRLKKRLDDADVIRLIVPVLPTGEQSLLTSRP